MSVKPVPDGFSTVTLHLTVKNCAEAIEFWKKALGATEVARHPMPDGRIMHAMIKIGDSVIMMADEFPEMGGFSPLHYGGSGFAINLYVDNVDALWKRATDAGMSVEMPLDNQFWGDRYGQLSDPYGFTWALSQHVKDLTPEEMGKAAEAAFAHNPTN